MNKKIIIIIISVIAVALLVFGIISLYNHTHTRQKYEDKLVQIEQGDIYSSAFPIAWEQLKGIMRRDISYSGEKSKLLEELNKSENEKDNVSEDKYYVVVEKNSQDLKKAIIENVGTKYSIDARGMLDNRNFKDNEKSFTLFAKLDPQFSFTPAFDKLTQNSTFADGTNEISYFGVAQNSSDKARESIKVLFYNDKNDFAIKISADTEEIILYRTDKLDGAFDELYEKVKNKKTRALAEKESVLIPYISLETLISYDELCNRTIQGTNKLFVQNALQSIKFELGQEGSLAAQSAIMEGAETSDKSFNFNDKFVIFVKETEKAEPYFSLKIKDDALLQ